MKWAIAQPKTQEVLSRLNAIRAGRGEVLAELLPKIEWSARGLASSDPEAEVAIRGIIACLKGDAKALDAAADEFEARFPDDLDGALNFLRSYTVMQNAAGVLRFAKHTMRLVGPSYIPAEVSLNLFSLGLFDELREMLAETNPDRDRLQDTDAASYRIVTAALEGFARNKITGEDFRSFLAIARKVIEEAGWPYPVDQLFTEPLDLDPDCPVATVVMDIDADPESLLDLEERMLAAVAASGHRIYERGYLALQMGIY